MKKIITPILLLVLSITSFSQQSKPPTREDYLNKSKRQHTIAWVLLAGGASCVLIVPLAWGITTKNGGGFQVVTGIFAAGLIAVPASIPLFIAAQRNKKKGMKLSFKNETIPQLQKDHFVNAPVPSLSLTISL